MRGEKDLTDSSRSQRRVVPENPFIGFARQDIEQSIAGRFEQIVCRDPRRPAIKSEEGCVTYDALNRMANRVAHALRLATGPGNEPVAVMGDHDIETIAVILGLLKAGKIYVPLDRSYSDAWIQFILHDTRAKTVLKTGKLSTLPTALRHCPCQVLDFGSLLSSTDEENVTEKISPDALSQILYTSGTTGQPKGVMDNQRNMLHNIMRLVNAFHIAPDDRMTMARPPSSGGGLCNVLLALLSGSLLYPVDIKRVGLAAIADWLLAEKITIFYVGAVIFRHFCQQLASFEKFPDLRLVRVGSGQMFDQDLELFKRYFPDALLLHNLSCTEANTYRVHFFDKDSQVAPGPLPVGYAVDDVEVLIVVEFDKELGVGQSGEIALRSAYLCLGYLNNPALTAAAFKGAPDLNGQSVFLTGDLGRLRADGCLEYLGRKDFRFKIRGHRIQAEEVELALQRLPEVTQAAVVAQKDANGDDRLVAYIAPATNAAPTVSQLRQSLKDTLADHMIPGRFVIVESLPQGSNGRVKRQELPVPAMRKSELGTEFRSPTNALEALLVKLWCENLNIDSVGVDDNFFDLGGDSILAMKVLAAMGRIFPWPLTLAELNEAATVSSLTRLLMQKEPNPEQAETAAGLYLQVDAMSDAEVEARIAQLEKELGSR